jgi:hypothetical protein
MDLGSPSCAFGQGSSGGLTHVPRPFRIDRVASARFYSGPDSIRASDGYNKKKEKRDEEL